MTILLLYLFLALAVSFLCSIIEAVLLSTPLSYLMAKEERKLSWPRKFIGLKSSIDRPLSAILSLNTIAHTVGAAGVGAQAVKVFGEAYFGLVSAILTILILIITEIIPKTIGAKFWKGLARFTYHTIQVLIIVTYPLVWLSGIITSWISKGEGNISTSREEISILASIGAKQGVFTEKEYKIIHNVLRLKNVIVKEIMTPRVVVAIANEDLLLFDFLKNKEYLKYSRIPVFHENIENITGYVFRQQVFEMLAEDQHKLRLKDIKREILVVPDRKVLFDVWEKMIEKKEHIALVVDEYGGMDGIVTLEDIIETLLGLEIVDEKDTITDMQKYARERWQSKQTKYQMISKPNQNDQ